MNSIFISGASGFIGRQLALTLANQGSPVHALVRTTSIVNDLIHPNITLFKGDILNVESIAKAMANCKEVYHLAGMAKRWMKDNTTYYDINVTGTKNIIEAADAAGVKKIVITSTAGVFPPANHHLVNERSIKRPELYTTYERTKNQAEELAKTYCQKGLPIVIVNPTKVFGPGIIDDCNTTTMMIRDYILGKWKFIPDNGNGIINYVFIDDVVSAIISAMKMACPGSQFIIGAENANYNKFFSIVRKQSGVQRKLINMPYSFIRTIALFEDVKAKLFKIKPLITTEWAKKVPYDWAKDITVAKEQLNYNPISLEDGIIKTIHWLKKTGQVEI